MEQVNAKRAMVFVVAACLVGMAVGSAVTLAVLNVQRAIPFSGMVVAVNVGVYSDAGCTLNLTSIDWGSVYPGGSVPRIIHVKNTDNAPINIEHDHGIVESTKNQTRTMFADCSVTRAF